ncbi:MAG: hypothetical protein AB8B74_12595 [Crocinitomicaceae bacterium]
MKRIATILFLGLIFAACNPEKKYASEIATIKTYEKSLDSLGEVYLAVKFDSLIMIQKQAQDYEKSIKTYYMADTISQDLASKLQYIKSVRKSLTNINVKKVSIGKELFALKTQFDNLKTDIIAGVFSAEQVTNYIAEEKQAYQALSLTISTLVNNEAKQLKDFKYAYPTVSEYVEIIKPKED